MVLFNGGVFSAWQCLRKDTESEVSLRSREMSLRTTERKRAAWCRSPSPVSRSGSDSFLRYVITNTSTEKHHFLQAFRRHLKTGYNGNQHQQHQPPLHHDHECRHCMEIVDAAQAQSLEKVWVRCCRCAHVCTMAVVWIVQLYCAGLDWLTAAPMTNHWRVSVSYKSA